MNTDIRLSVEFTTHHKTLKLRRRLGADGVLALVTLWLWAAKHRPDGTLAGMDPEDIEIAAQWEGQPGRLVADLTDIGFLEDSDGSTRIHNWEWRNPWAAKSEERSAATRLSRLARVRPDIVKKLKAKGVEGVSEAEYQKYAHIRNVVRNVQRTRTKRSTPTPTPDPNPDYSQDPSLIEKPTVEKIVECAEPKVDSTPNGGGILIHLPTNRKGENYAVPKHAADEWRELYPAVSVDAELRKMRGWLLANPDRRKTSRGMSRFIANWLARQQDRGGTATTTTKTKAERLAELQASIERAEREEAERESA